MSNPHRFSLVAVLCMSAVAWANPNSPDPRRSERESGEVARVRHHLETAEALLLKSLATGDASETQSLTFLPPAHQSLPRAS